MSKHKPEQAMAAAEAAICEAINNARSVADKYGLSFEIAGARGMGGTYYSPEFLKKDLERHDNSEPFLNEKYAIANEYKYYLDVETGGWVSSSMEC